MVTWIHLVYSYFKLGLVALILDSYFGHKNSRIAHGSSLFIGTYTRNIFSFTNWLIIMFHRNKLLLLVTDYSPALRHGV